MVSHPPPLIHTPLITHTRPSLTQDQAFHATHQQRAAVDLMHQFVRPPTLVLHHTIAVPLQAPHVLPATRVFFLVKGASPRARWRCSQHTGAAHNTLIAGDDVLLNRFPGRTTPTATTSNSAPSSSVCVSTQPTQLNRHSLARAQKHPKIRQEVAPHAHVTARTGPPRWRTHERCPTSCRTTLHCGSPVRCMQAR